MATEQTAKQPASLPEAEVAEGQVHGYVGQEEGDVVTTPAFQPGQTNVEEGVTSSGGGTAETDEQRRAREAKSRSPRENK